MLKAIPYKTKSGKSQYKPQLTDQDFRILSDDMSGFCLACGSDIEGCEPDMRNGKCEVCDEPKVFGLEELLMIGLVELV
jgi:hypothetical protein